MAIPRQLARQRSARWHFVFILAVSLALVLGFSSTASAAETFLVTQITNNGYTDTEPQVSGDRVVWHGVPGADYQIFTWTPNDGETQITSTLSDDMYPQVSGGRVVWIGLGSASDDVFSWTLSGGVVQLISNNHVDSQARISGDRVVWEGYDGSDWEILTWTPTVGLDPVTYNDHDHYYPQVSGDRVVWYGAGGSDGGTDTEIFTWTPAGGVFQVTTNSVDDEKPWVSGDRVAWQRHDGSDWEIFTWTPSEGATQITTNTSYDFDPQVSGNRVVWERWDGSDYEILTWTPGPSPGGTIIQITDNGTSDIDPRVSADRVVWERHDGFDWEIFTWTPSEGETQITDNGDDDSKAHVSGDRLVWQVDDGSDWEICTAVLAVSTTYQQTDPKFTYMGDWTSVSSPVYSGGSLAYTNVKGSTITAKFEGTSLEWIGTKADNYGQATLTLDGTPYVVNCYEPTTVHQATIWEIDSLGAGEHTVSIQCTGTGYIGVDAFQILGSLVQADTPTRNEETEANIGYSGAWTPASNSVYSAGSFRYLNSTGATTVKFDGTQLSWIGTKAATYGQAMVTLDGGPAVTVDCYSPYTLFQADIYTTGILPAGEHTLLIEWAGTKHPSASNTYISLDAFDVMGTLMVPDPLLPVPITYQQTESKLTYMGNWSVGSHPVFSGGSMHYTASAGSTVTVEFDGTYLQWIGTKAATYGEAEVYVDGVLQPTVDLYSATTLYQTSIWDTGILPDAVHTVTIQCAGTKNALATNYYIGVDAFEILDTLEQADTPTPYEETDALIGYTGPWVPASHPVYSGGTFRYINGAGNFTVNFNGTQLSWIGTKAATYGQATVTLDGGPAVMVDCYNPTTLFQADIYSTGILTAGAHTLLIEWAGTKNTSASNYYISLDALDVIGTLVP